MKVDIDKLIAGLENPDPLRPTEVFDFTDEERKIITAGLRVLKQALGHGPFITAPVGKKDKSGLHDGYLICPTLGVDGSILYTKTDKYVAPEW